MLRRLTWQSFRIPFRAPFATARGTMLFREGIILRLETEDGLIGVGEASPLPAWGGGAVADVHRLLIAGAPRSPCQRGAPALLCALDTARLDLLAKGKGVRLADILADRGSRGAVEAVTVNAAVGVGDPSAAASAAARAAHDGFGCVKLKVGMLGSPRAEAARVARVRDALGPGVALRLDANGAWDAPRAIETIRACEPYRIELVEQPVPADEIHELALVSRAVDTPVAADEAVGDPVRARRVIEQRASDLIVLKPMALGGCTRSLQLAQEARRAAMGVLVTTTLDAGVGVATALHLAAALQPLAASGLATAALLESDLLCEGIPVGQGTMRMPAGPGLGIALDEGALRRYAGPYRGEVWVDDVER